MSDVKIRLTLPEQKLPFAERWRLSQEQCLDSVMGRLTLSLSEMTASAEQQNMTNYDIKLHVPDFLHINSLEDLRELVKFGFQFIQEHDFKDITVYIPQRRAMTVDLVGRWCSVYPATSQINLFIDNFLKDIILKSINFTL